LESTGARLKKPAMTVGKPRLEARWGQNICTLLFLMELPVFPGNMANSS
jgi:hypothetical protein